MDYLTIDGAGAFILLVLPGAISLQVYRMILPSKRLSWPDAIPQAMFYSLLNFAALFPLVRFLLDGDNLLEHPVPYWVVLVLCIIAAPVAWPILYRLMLRGNWFRSRLQQPFPTSWDFHFYDRRPAFLLVTLNDGTQIGGFYGKRSYATTFPNDGDIYLEVTVEVDEQGRFGSPIEGSTGILLRKDQYQLIEFFDNPHTGGIDGAT